MELDSNGNSTENKLNEALKNSKRNKLFVTYCLMAVCWGLCELIGALIYIELQHQLNTTEQAIAFCFTTRSISGLIFGIVTGKVVDHFTESHRFIATTIILYIASMIYLPFTRNIYVLHIIFAIYGALVSVIIISMTVYILRLYSDCKRELVRPKLYTALAVYGLTKTIYPILMDLSIKYSHSYIYPLYISLIFCIILVILLFIQKTPIHDQHRTIKAELKDNEIESNNSNAIKILEILNKDKQIIICQHIIIVVLNLIMLIYAAIWEYFITFSTVYCDYLNLGQDYGRLLISTYFFGQLIYRILNAICSKCRNITPEWQTFSSFVVLSAVTTIFLFMYDKVIWMFFVWFFCGCFSAAIVPEITIWTELIKPVTGTINFWYSFSNALGEIIAVFGFGVLLDMYSISILKYLMFGFSVSGFIIVALNVVIYAYYAKRKESIIKNASNILPETDIVSKLAMD
eukprot:245887_1